MPAVRRLPSAFAAPLLGARRHAVPFFSALTVLSVLLTLQQQTLVYRAFSVLPAFERVHDHSRGRIALLTYLGVAYLAGAAVSNLRRLSGRRAALCWCRCSRFSCCVRDWLGTIW